MGPKSSIGRSMMGSNLLFLNLKRRASNKNNNENEETITENVSSGLSGRSHMSRNSRMSGVQADENLRTLLD